MNLQYLTESSYLLPVCSNIAKFGGGEGEGLQLGQLLFEPVKTLYLQYRQSHAGVGLSEKIPSLVYKVIKCIFCFNPHFIDLNFYKNEKANYHLVSWVSVAWL